MNNLSNRIDTVNSNLILNSTNHNVSKLWKIDEREKKNEKNIVRMHAQKLQTHTMCLELVRRKSKKFATHITQVRRTQVIRIANIFGFRVEMCGRTLFFFSFFCLDKNEKKNKTSKNFIFAHVSFRIESQHKLIKRKKN